MIIHRRTISYFLVIVMVLGLVTVTPQRAYAYSTYETTLELYHSILNTFGIRYHFTDFLRDHAGAARPNAEYIIEADSYILAEGFETRIYQDFEGVQGASVWTDEIGLIEWEIYVSQGGLYNLSILYYSYPGKNSDIQRAIFINGEQPFFEAAPVEFPRTWVNQLPYIRRDNRDNDLRPVQVEYHTWREAVARDSLGAYIEPFSFYLQAGRNTIGFYAQREPMLIRHLHIHQVPIAQPYSIVSQEFLSNGAPRPQIDTIRIEGQLADRRSSPMLAPQADNSGPGVTPYSPRAIRINHIGGYSWSQPNSWIEWDFYVPQDGLYHIALNSRQHFTRGTSTFRRIVINDEVPFEEMEAVRFQFDTRWRTAKLACIETSEPFLFWLNAGQNTIRMEAIMGDYAPYYREIQESVLNMNNLYRQIVMIIGLSPDIFRDYQIERRLPYLYGELRYEREKMDRIFLRLNELADGRGERDAVVNNMSVLLSRLYADIEAIPRRIHDFRINTGALGTWLMDVREQRLAIGEIYIISYGGRTPTNNNGFFAQAWHEMRTLFWSFFIDYNTIGDVIEGEDVDRVEVWLGTGRDQAHIIRAMIDETFARDTDINVDLLLVDIANLLPATLAGQGPCVTLMLGQDVPMNFGMRGAVRDLAGFDGFDEVVQRFPGPAMYPFTFDGMTFALPETFTFNMLFYRMDVLYEIGLEPPDTWSDVRASMSVLAQHHMEFGLPLEAGVFNITDMTFGMFLFQNGGEFYNHDGSRSALDSDISLSAFRDFTRFFTDYNLPEVYDFANRFRAGDMPIAIADYTNYNLLQVFAPEIRGLWGFRPVPGTPQPDGSINRAVASGGSAVVMMQAADYPESAWEFLRWWTSAEVQLQFGRGMESLMGAAARHPTANLEAFSQMPWPVRDYQMLQSQFGYARGIPQVPGGYFTARQIRNAFYTATIQQTINPREAMTEFVRFINDEIRAKRIEFGLDVDM